jgi:hypothetical protein
MRADKGKARAEPNLELQTGAKSRGSTRKRVAKEKARWRRQQTEGGGGSDGLVLPLQLINGGSFDA